MKYVSIGPERLGGSEMTMDQAFTMVSSDDVMRKVYGPSLIIKEWKGDTRVLEFNIDICDIPKELALLLGSEDRITLNVSNIQTVFREHDKIQIENVMHVNIILGRLVDIKAIFVIHRGLNEDVYISGAVEHQARLSLMSGLAETFMALQTEKLLGNYKVVLLKTCGTKALNAS